MTLNQNSAVVSNADGKARPSVIVRRASCVPLVATALWVLDAIKQRLKLHT
jgi:hypothetical protein